MGFKLFFAGGERLTEPIPEDSCCGYLNSYAIGEKQLDKFISNTKGDLFIDSGAFSVHHSGAKVNIDSYIEYIKRHDEPMVWATFDVIPFPFTDKDDSELVRNSSEKTWEQYLYIMDRIPDDKRDKLLPIYHFGEPIEALERMINTEVHGRLAPYIGIGGRHGVSKQAHKTYFENLFSVIKNTKNPNVKIHAFGMTMLDMLELFPFYSADSTTWLMTSINGKIHCYKSYRTYVVSDRQTKELDHFNSQNPEIQKLLLSEIEKYGNGVTLEQLSTDYNARLKYNRDFFLWWAENYKYKGNLNTRKRSLLDRLNK